MKLENELDNIEELEDFEEIEEISELEIIETSDTADENIDDLSMQEVPDTKLSLFSNNPFPVLIINNAMRIVFSNPACSKLFESFYTFKQSLFTDVFAHALGPQGLSELHRTIHSGERSYSWKGVIRSKTRESGTMLTKAYMFPLYTDSPGKPEFFVVLFDDITEENKNLLRSVFLSLLEASKLKDNDTGKHINRVNLYSKLLSEYLFEDAEYPEIDRDFIDDIAFLAAMHDVGKIGTPDDILNKEGPLEEWEWSIMKEHTKNGAYILSTYPTPMAREIALYHHERWDGNGYPYRLEGSMIPLAARIVSIADVYDALRMERSYKKSFDHESAAKKIRDWKSTHFDPRLVDAFEALDMEFDRIYRLNADKKES